MIPEGYFMRTDTPHIDSPMGRLKGGSATSMCRWTHNLVQDRSEEAHRYALSTHSQYQGATQARKR